MENNLALFLWRRRWANHLKMIREGLVMICDFWTTLYIIVPALLILGYVYVKLLAALPGWFDPRWEVLLTALLAYFMVRGNLRTYIREADLVYLNKEKAFDGLVRLGMLSSLLINCLGVLLLLIWLYPFYMHLEAASPVLWLAAGGWVLVLRMISLLLAFHLHTGKTKTVYKMIFMALFITVWNQVVMPFISMGDVWCFTVMIGFLIIMVFAAILSIHFLPVKDWEKLVQEEVAYNIRLLGSLLGYAGKSPRKRHRCSILSKTRLGLPFKSRYTLTYFYLKYFLRNKEVLKLFMQIFSFSILVIYTLSYMESILFIAAGNFMWGLLVTSIVNDNAGKLKHYTTGLEAKDRVAGLGVLYVIIMTPIYLVPLVLSGTIPVMHVLQAILILFLAALMSVRFLCTRVF